MCPVSVRSSSIQTPGLDVTGLDVVAQARSWLGTPFRHQGRLKGVGVDCAGLIIGVGHNFGLSDFDYRTYSHMPDGKTMRRICKENLDSVSDMRLGDVLLMKFKIHPQHLAIVGDGGTPFSIIHAYAEARKCVEHRLDQVWMARICGIYRFKGTG